jgi:hypothetical protein
MWRILVADSENHSRPAPAGLALGFHDSILKTLFHMKAHPQSHSTTLAVHLDQLQSLPFGVENSYPFPDMTKGGTWWNRLDAMSIGNFHAIYSNLIDENAIIRFQRAITMDDHRLFRTVEGDLGYGPRPCVVGDQVWVLENGRIPFILRSTCNTSSLDLVGECYVHGIMDGQLMAEGPIDNLPITLP